MFFIAYTFKGQLHVLAGRVKIVSNWSCRTSAILKYICPLIDLPKLVCYVFTCTSHLSMFHFFTCVALAKAGLVVGPLRPSVRLSIRSSVRPFVCPSVRLSATILGCLVCVICNFNSFHSYIFQLCQMIVHTLKMCTSYFVQI